MSEDLDSSSGVLFFALFGLIVVIVLLGTFLLARLRKAEEEERPGARSRSIHPVGQAVLVVMLITISFLSTFTPFLALLPALIFCVLAVRAFFDRQLDGGIVLSLVGIAWIVFTTLQAVLEAWSKTIAGAPIRIDIVITVPAMAFLGVFGWIIHSALPVKAGRLRHTA